MYNAPLRSELVQRLFRELQPNQELYFSMYKSTKAYNQQRPFHEDTGKLFSLKEKEEFQKKNLRNLEALAKAEKLEKNVRFRLNRELKISMYVNDFPYHPDSSTKSR